MDLPWTWEKIDNFGSLRERDSFLAWMQHQIAAGIAEPVDAPSEEPSEPGDQWFKHLSTGSLWRLVPVENPYGPGFWPADEDEIPHDLPPTVTDHGSWPPTSQR